MMFCSCVSKKIPELTEPEKIKKDQSLRRGMGFIR